MALLLNPGQDRLELVAAEPADLPILAEHFGEAAGHLLQQFVADRVAERVVDLLEAIEVDDHQGAAPAAGVGIGERLVQHGPHHRPVGQVGEAVVARQLARFGLVPALLAEIAAKAAEAEKAAVIVEIGIARKQPPDFVGRRRRRAHDDVGEGETGGEMEAQGATVVVLAVAVEPEHLLEAAADQLGGGESEMICERLRNVAQCPVGLGLPEPAAAARLEVGDEAARFFRPPFERETLARGEEKLARAGDPEAHQEEAERPADGDDRLLARHERSDQEGRRERQDHQQRHREEDCDGGTGTGDERRLDEERLRLGRDEESGDEPKPGRGGALQEGEAHRLIGTKRQPLQGEPERAVEEQDGEQKAGEGREPRVGPGGGEPADQHRAPQRMGPGQERQRQLDRPGPPAGGAIVVFIGRRGEIEQQELRELRRSDGLQAPVAQTGEPPFAHSFRIPIMIRRFPLKPGGRRLGSRG